MRNVFFSMGGRLTEMSPERPLRDLQTGEDFEARDAYDLMVMRRLNEMEVLALLAHVGDAPIRYDVVEKMFPREPEVLDDAD